MASGVGSGFRQVGLGPGWQPSDPGPPAMLRKASGGNPDASIGFSQNTFWGSEPSGARARGGGKGAPDRYLLPPPASGRHNPEPYPLELIGVPSATPNFGPDMVPAACPSPARDFGLRIGLNGLACTTVRLCGSRAGLAGFLCFLINILNGSRPNREHPY